MVAIHLFIRIRFLRNGKGIMALLGIFDVSYNSPAYRRALFHTQWILSVVIGSLLVFAVNKLIEKLAEEWDLLPRRLFLGVIPGACFAVHILAVLGLWVFNRPLAPWLYPLLAYGLGTALWGLSDYKVIKTEIQDIRKGRTT